MNSDVIQYIYRFAPDCRPLALTAHEWYNAYLVVPDAIYWQGGRAPALVLPKMVGPVWWGSAADLVAAANIPALLAAFTMVPAGIYDRVMSSLLEIASSHVDGRLVEFFHSFGYCHVREYGGYMGVSRAAREWYKTNCKCEGVDEPDYTPPRRETNTRARAPPYTQAQAGMHQHDNVINIGTLVAAAEQNWLLFVRLFELASVRPAQLVKIAAENHVTWRIHDPDDVIAALKMYYRYGYKVRARQLSPHMLWCSDIDWLIEHYREMVEAAAATPPLFTAELSRRLRDAGIKLVPTMYTLTGAATFDDIAAQVAADPALLSTDISMHLFLVKSKWRVLWRGSRAETVAALVRLGFDNDTVEICAWTIPS